MAPYKYEISDLDFLNEKNEKRIGSLKKSIKKEEARLPKLRRRIFWDAIIYGIVGSLLAITLITQVVASNPYPPSDADALGAKVALATLYLLGGTAFFMAFALLGKKYGCLTVEIHEEKIRRNLRKLKQLTSGS